MRVSTNSLLLLFFLVVVHALIIDPDARSIGTPLSSFLALLGNTLCFGTMTPPPSTIAAAKKRQASSLSRSASLLSRKRSATSTTAVLPSKRLSAASASKPSSDSAKDSAAKKKRDSVQVHLAFGTVEKYKIGLKVLLDDSIYDDKSPVRSFVIVVLFVFLLHAMPSTNVPLFCCHSASLRCPRSTRDTYSSMRL